LILWVVYQPKEYEGPEKTVTSREARPGSPERPPIPEDPSHRHLKIAILIDDIGQDLKPLDELPQIGHPYPETIQALKTFLPGLRSAGVEVITLSELINENGKARPAGHARSQRG
jgi:hypothetical protein